MPLYASEVARFDTPTTLVPPPYGITAACFRVGPFQDPLDIALGSRVGDEVRRVGKISPESPHNIAITPGPMRERPITPVGHGDVREVTGFQARRSWPIPAARASGPPIPEAQLLDHQRNQSPGSICSSQCWSPPTPAPMLLHGFSLSWIRGVRSRVCHATSP